MCTLMGATSGYEDEMGKGVLGCTVRAGLRSWKIDFPGKSYPRLVRKSR